MERFSHDAHVGFHALQRFANLARAGTDAFDCVVDYKNHANALIYVGAQALPSARASEGRSDRFRGNTTCR